MSTTHAEIQHSASMPDREVPAKATRCTFSAAYKFRILDLSVLAVVLWNCSVIGEMVACMHDHNHD